MAERYTVMQQSLEYLHVPITGPGTASLTAAAISLGIGAPTTWIPADGWDGTTAKLLVGPGSTVGQLTAGAVPVYVKVAAAPETIILSAGPIYVTTV